MSKKPKFSLRQRASGRTFGQGLVEVPEACEATPSRMLASSAAGLSRNPGSRPDQSAAARTGILLFHSLGGIPQELRTLELALSQVGYRVSCPLIPGLTAGTDIAGLARWQDWLAAARSAYDALSEQCDTVIIAGFSAGGALALRLAHEQPAAGGVVLLAPTLWPNGWALPWYFHLFRLVRERWTAGLFRFDLRAPYGIKDDRIRNFIIESAKSGTELAQMRHCGRRLLQLRRLGDAVRPLLPQIRHRTLIIHPRRDDQSALSNAMTLQTRLGGLVETCVLDDSYHMVTLDRQRGYVSARVAEFVGRIAWNEAVNSERRAACVAAE